MENCYIPFEIQEDIMKRLPVKSLIRFRSVSKPWKSLIHSSKFIIDHTSHHDHPQHMLIRYDDSQNNRRYVSIVDDNTFPKHKFPLIVPVSLTQLRYSQIGGYNQGLFFFYSIYSKTAVIWNPTIRKLVDIDVPNLLPRFHFLNTFISFAVSPETKDPKLVKITYVSHPSQHDKRSSIPRQVEVFTLSTRVWRSLSINLPRLSIRFTYDSQVVIDGFIYWCAYKISHGHDGYCLIMSFNLTSEEFTEIDLPDSLEKCGKTGLCISKLKESLIVLDYTYRGFSEQVCVWMMENGDPKSFNKLFNIETSMGSINNVHGFRKSGEVIIQMANQDFKNTSLCVYDPYTQNIDDIDIYEIGNAYHVFVCSYMETLLLIDH